MSRRPHAADQYDEIARATSFSVALYCDRKFLTERNLQTLEDAIRKREQLDATPGATRRAIVYAVLTDGRAVPVPRDYSAPIAKESPMKKSTAKKPAVAASRPRSRTMERRKVAKAPRVTQRENKSDVVERMLTTGKGATRAELSEASGWPYVNLKMAAKRAKKNLVHDEKSDRFRLV